MSFGFFSSFKNKNKKSEENEVLSKNNIKVGLRVADKYEAIRMAGRLLVEGGYVDENYIDAMIRREDDLSTYMGNGVAIPHGVGRAKEFIKKSGLVVLQFPEGIDFGEEKAYLVIGIAGVGDEHLNILSNIATIIGEDENTVSILRDTEDVDYIYKTFTEF